MFDKLDDLLIRFEEVLNELGEPGEMCIRDRGWLSLFCFVLLYRT